VVVDGLIATASVLVAARLAPAVLDYAVFAHASGDGVHRQAVTALGGKPLLDLGLRLGEGTGAALAWPLVVAAAAFLDEMATFSSAGVSDRTR
jgi:nicotinate-nucleotide--dimethylbenzimidazole phosphoribosyltransferase